MADFDEDEVFELLRAAMADDVVPPAVVAEAELIPEIDRLHAEIASLLDAPLATRSGDPGAVYAIDDVYVTVTPEADGMNVDVVGVSEPRVALLVAGERVDAERVGARFRIVTSLAGPARIEVSNDDRSVVTEWFTLG